MDDGEVLGQRASPRQGEQCLVAGDEKVGAAIARQFEKFLVVRIAAGGQGNAVGEQLRHRPGGVRVTGLGGRDTRAVEAERRVVEHAHELCRARRIRQQHAGARRERCVQPAQARIVERPQGKQHVGVEHQPPQGASRRAMAHQRGSGNGGRSPRRLDIGRLRRFSAFSPCRGGT
jgi:hypothetical protein